MSFRSDPVCGNADCPCIKPSMTCPEFMGHAAVIWCHRCGWERADHAK